MSKTTEIRQRMQGLINKKHQDAGVTFFKTGKGQYSEHDKFLGITTPNLRKLSKEFIDISWSDLKEFIRSEYNDERAFALFILVDKYSRGDEDIKKQAFDFYIKNMKFVNNWNLVDISAHYIIGQHIFLGLAKKSILDELVISKNMWERRISIVSTWYLIRQGEVDITFKLAAKLLGDKEDLIYKATGWMLREAGKKDINKLRDFLNKNIRKMPRTSLRYAIERFSEKERLYFLHL